jgi:D-serine deaminase-like pyridoxal phosphate-dependent protein
MSKWEKQVGGPALLLLEERARANIQRMAAKTGRSGALLRPHFKTHQSAEVGAWFRDAGVRAITVSSVAMATYFAQNGWFDILIAFPLNWREVNRINRLAAQVNLGVLVESAETADFLARRVTSAVTVWIKVDAGYQRTGLSWDNHRGVLEVAAMVDAAPNLTLAGLLTHAGDTYQAKTVAQVTERYKRSVARLQDLRSKLAAAGLDSLAISVGDTPGCSVVDDLGDVDEVRAGNFVFYDLMQLALGSCREEDIAVALACPVVATHPERNQIVVYGGAVHLSLAQAPGPGLNVNYGRIAWPAPDGWSRLVPDSFVATLSQEHGVVQASQDLLEHTMPGDVLMVVPAHSCLTADLMGRYLTLQGRWISTMRTAAWQAPGQP